MFVKGMMAVVLGTLLVAAIIQAAEAQQHTKEEHQQQHQDLAERSQQKEEVQQQQQKEEEVQQEQQQENRKEVVQKEDSDERSRFLLSDLGNADVSVTIGSSTLVVFFVAVVSFVVALSVLLDVVSAARVKYTPDEAHYAQPPTFALPVPIPVESSYGLQQSLEKAQKKYE
nr:anaphase-promoting complex subunit 4-like [Procambarus clarkii]